MLVGSVLRMKTMKNKTLFLVIMIVVLDLIAAYNVINSSIDPHAHDYENAIKAAEEYEEQGLCSRAISAYSFANEIKDSYDLRMKIADLYEKGYLNGEFQSLSGKYSTLDNVINAYPDETESYDMLISYYEGKQDYKKCSEYVKIARKNKISTKTVDECYEKIRHMYKESGLSCDELLFYGDVYFAVSEVREEEPVYDENGEIVYEENEDGDSVPKMNVTIQNEYTTINPGATASSAITALNCSPYASVAFSENEKHTMWFEKCYGNTLDGEQSDKEYTYFMKDGVRQCYVGEDAEYEANSTFSSGIISLYNTKTQKYDLLDYTGKVLATGYDEAGVFTNDRMYVVKDGKGQILDTSGKVVNEKEIDDVITSFGGRCSSSNHMFVKYSGSDKYLLINSENLDESDFTCDDADLYLGSAAAFERDGKWGFVDAGGNVVIEPKYDKAKSFSNGYAAVMKDGMWGFINTSEEMIIEPVFEDAMYFMAGGSVYAKRDGVWRMISLYYNNDD